MQTDIIEATASVSKFGLTESAASRIATMLENEPDGSFFRVAVLGGGLMGGGIAFVTATKAKLPVRIKDISHQGISHAQKK